MGFGEEDVEEQFGPTGPVGEARRVTPYDPMVTLKKALLAALTSAGAIALTALLTWLGESDNLKFVLNYIGVKGALAIVAIPVLQAVIVAARNWMKTRHGVPYERREEFRKDLDHAPKAKPGQKLVQPPGHGGPPKP